MSNLPKTREREEAELQRESRKIIKTLKILSGLLVKNSFPSKEARDKVQHGIEIRLNRLRNIESALESKKHPAA